MEELWGLSTMKQHNDFSQRGALFRKTANIRQMLRCRIYSLRHRKCGVRGFIHELFVSKPERARYERVRAFDTNNEWIKPRTKHFLCRELFITQNRRIFIELAFWTQIGNKNSLTTEPNANLILFSNKVRFARFARAARVIGMETPLRYRWLVILSHVK